jgi:hypothetical protein
MFVDSPSPIRPPTPHGQRGPARRNQPDWTTNDRPSGCRLEPADYVVLLRDRTTSTTIEPQPGGAKGHRPGRRYRRHLVGRRHRDHPLCG